MYALTNQGNKMKILTKNENISIYDNDTYYDTDGNVYYRSEYEGKVYLQPARRLSQPNYGMWERTGTEFLDA